MTMKELLFINLSTHSRILEYGKVAYNIDLTNSKTIPPMRNQSFL